MNNKEVPLFENWPYKVPSIKSAVKKVETFTEHMKEAKDGAEALRVYKAHVRFFDKLSTEIGHVQVLFTLESTNPVYERDNNKLDEGLPLLQNAETAFMKAMVESPYREYLEKKLGSHLFKIYDYSLRSFSPEIIEEAIEENKLSSEYGKTVAEIQIEFRGEKYNTSQMGKFLNDNDRETRKEASEVYYKALSEVAPKLEDIYDKLVKVRDKMAKKLGFKNYVELGYLRMSRYDYDAKDTASYRDAIGKFVTPLAGKLVKDQFRRIGIKKPEIYDLALMFKDGNPIPKGTTEEKVASARKMYALLSEEASYWFNFMDDHHLLQLEAKKGKQPGGYMTNFEAYKVPFIFSNFNGTSGDIDVLTHEFGHSLQYCLARDIKVPEYRSPTMEGAEIDSMSMEFFAEPYMDLFFDDPLKYRYEHLADSISFLPYGVTVDEFQHFVYENPNASKEERLQKWHEIELKYTPYKVALYKDNEYLSSGRRWLMQGHIFSSPFYYIDYTLAQVMAFEFFNLDRKNHELAWKRYVKLCKMGGKYPFRTLVTKCGMKDPFQEGVIEKTIKPLVKQLKTYGF